MIKTIMVVSAATLLACISSQDAWSCGDGTFIEPEVSFQGISTRSQMDSYIEGINNQNFREFEDLTNCLSRSEDFDPPEYNRVANLWRASERRFRNQLKQAGEAHLALIASQPFKGAYDGTGMSSTGGATSPSPAPEPSSNRSNVEAPAKVSSKAPAQDRIPSYSNNTPQRSSSTADAKSSAGATDYAPIDGCLTAQNGKSDFGQISRITNNCKEPLEAIWIDTNGGKNSWSIGAKKSYQGGSPVSKLWACRKNDALILTANNTKAFCRHR